MVAYGCGLNPSTKKFSQLVGHLVDLGLKIENS
jgi:hypothetical protein